MSGNRCIIVTGTIVPNSNYVAVADPATRLEEYAVALRFYADNCRDHICFIENSTYDIEADRAFSGLLADRGIQLIKFPPSKESDKGKGYQEFEMLDAAVKQLSSSFESFVKITGRQRIMNIAKVCRLRCDNIIIDRYRDLRVALTNLFVVRMEFYSHHFKGAYREMDDSKGVYAEHVIYKKLRLLAGRVSLFPYSPIVRGVSGSYGRELGGNRLKFALRNAERRWLRLAGINEFARKY
ncbi:MAG: hypothetical protein ACE5DN_01225 [Flavobacteriales bacterium]